MTLNLEDLHESLVLPDSQWTRLFTRDALQVCKLQQPSPSSSAQSAPVVTHSLKINSDLTWLAFVHGHRVDSKLSPPLSTIPDKLDPEALNRLLSKLDTSTVCPGHPDKQFVEMVLSKKGKLPSRSGEVVASVDTYAPVKLNGEMYAQTVRNMSCEIIVNGIKCSKCVKYRGTLRKAHYRWVAQKNMSPKRRTSSTSRINFQLLNTPEKQQRYRNLKARSVAAERKLKEAMKKLTRERGVNLEPQLHDDLTSVMNELTGEIRQNYPEDSFRRLFWEQQLQALKAKDCRQVRWHPALIKWCLHLKFKSSSSYDALRSTGVLTLPSERTLRDYTHWMKSEVGFQSAVNEQLIMEADVKEEKDKYVVLVFDEMKIREDLVFDKHSCELVGFVNLGEINNVLTEFERQCKGETDAVVDEDAVATHMLTFMVRGIFTKLEFPYAQFPTRGVTADKLFPIVWDAVRNLEECGLKVMVITCDGASPNRKFFKMHKAARKPHEVVYKTPNPFSEDKRDIFFISDVPHLIKTTRNCWENSFGHSHTRALWVSNLVIIMYHTAHASAIGYECACLLLYRKMEST